MQGGGYGLRDSVNQAGSSGGAGGFLHQLDPALRKRCELRLRTLRVPQGRTLVEHGSVTNDVFLVVEGELRVLLYSPSGREVSVTSVGPGEMIGEYAALDELGRAATVVAATAAVVRALPKSEFRACLESSPRAAFWLARHLLKQIRALNNRLFELATLSVNNRLHFELLRLALLTGADSNATLVRDAPTHQELANRIGTSRESVSRELRSLARRAIVRQRGRDLEIRDIGQLAAIVQQFSGQVAGIYMAPHTHLDRTPSE
jgi:CRP-like cAMP-binding protein